MRTLLAAAFVPSLLAALPAQSNTVPGLGSRLSDLSGLSAFGRLGTYPNGRNGLAASVSVCNNGTALINWQAAMAPDHPFYAFMLCRLSGGRFAQISDWSYVKHGFASVNSDCGGCIQPPGGSSQLGIHCGDTYGAGLNADRYWLGPPAEIDPWLLVWNPVGSHFDRGEPDVGPPQDQDGLRSLTSTMADALGPVKHRIEVDDADLAVPGATFCVAGRVLTKGEAEATREDNLLSRRYTATWNGSQWLFSAPQAPVAGTVLHQWTGAILRSGTNGSDDGRVWIGAQVTALGNGLYHYEYALHNRDNGRGIAGFHVPRCPTARILAAGFRDIDRSPLDDWAIHVGASEVSFLAAAANALEWNMVFNVWFDSDAAPAGGSWTLDEARPGAGALQFAVSDVPSPLQLGNEYLGDGCGAQPPALYAVGSPALANIPNAGFGLQVAAHPGAGVVLAGALQALSLPLGNGCTRYLDPASTTTLAFGLAGGGGTLLQPLPVPNLPALEGVDLVFQAGEVAAGGALSGLFDLSNGLRVRIGNARAGCP